MPTTVSGPPLVSSTSLGCLAAAGVRAMPRHKGRRITRSDRIVTMGDSNVIPFKKLVSGPSARSGPSVAATSARWTWRAARRQWASPSRLTQSLAVPNRTRCPCLQAAPVGAGLRKQHGPGGRLSSHQLLPPASPPCGAGRERDEVSETALLASTWPVLIPTGVLLIPCNLHPCQIG